MSRAAAVGLVGHEAEHLDALLGRLDALASGQLARFMTMSLDPVAFKKTKHILRAAEFLRDLVARDVVRMQHLPGKIMVADLLTKAVARVLFASLMDLIRQYAESGVACPST